MRTGRLILLAGLIAVCITAALVGFGLNRFQSQAKSARISAQLRVPRKLCIEDFQTVEDERLMEWLRMVEENKTTKAVDAYLIKPLLDDLNTSMRSVEDVEVTTNQLPHLNATIETCARILHLQKSPRVFVSAHTTLPVCTVNYAEPLVVIESGLLNRFRDPAEIRFLIGRELGHIKAGHVRWLVLIRQIKTLADKMTFLGSGKASSALLPALHWARACEMSADNAGCICAQDPRVGERVLLQMATGIGSVAEFVGDSTENSGLTAERGTMSFSL